MYAATDVFRDTGATDGLFKRSLRPRSIRGAVETDAVGWGGAVEQETREVYGGVRADTRPMGDGMVNLVLRFACIKLGGG